MKRPTDVSFEVSIPSNYLRIVLDGAGSRYWLRDWHAIDERDNGRTFGECVLEGAGVLVEPFDDEGTTYRVDYRGIVSALAALPRHAPNVLFDLLAGRDALARYGNADATTGDLLIQYAAFGEERYA